jgi:hypothetical protein
MAAASGPPPSHREKSRCLVAVAPGPAGRFGHRPQVTGVVTRSAVTPRHRQHASTRRPPGRPDAQHGRRLPCITWCRLRLRSSPIHQAEKTPSDIEFLPVTFSESLSARYAERPGRGAGPTWGCHGKFGAATHDDRHGAGHGHSEVTPGYAARPDTRGGRGWARRLRPGSGRSPWSGRGPESGCCDGRPGSRCQGCHRRRLKWPSG